MRPTRLSSQFLSFPPGGRAAQLLMPLIRPPIPRPTQRFAPRVPIERQRLARSENLLEMALERGGRRRALDDDEVVILMLETRGGEIRRAGAQQAPVDLVGFEVHQRRPG